MSDVHEALKNLVERLHDAARENLESITLYGSAARGDFHEAHSDLNVLCILRSLRAAQLARVSGVVKWWTTVQHQTAPLFFSAEELRQSADVFAIEVLDMQESHRVLYGTDVVAGINVPMNLHRVHVEHELRTLLLKLRQHLLRDEENQQELGAILGKHVREKLKTDWNRAAPGGSRVKINSVGFYFDSPDVGAFLWSLSRENDGSFVGMSKP